MTASRGDRPLSAARWGWAGISIEWRRGMRGHGVGTPLVDRLVGSTGARTSSGLPLRVDEVDLRGTSLDGSGRVGITFLPGKKQDGFSGTHWRDLGRDLARLRELGVDALFLLVEDSELDRCHVAELPEMTAAAGPELLRFQIPDPHIPADPAAYRTAIIDLADRVRAGRFVAIACRSGSGRRRGDPAHAGGSAGLDHARGAAGLRASLGPGTGEAPC